MSNTAAWTSGILTSQAEEKPSATRRFLLPSTLMLVLGVIVGMWLYFEETQVVSKLALQPDSGAASGEWEAALALLQRFHRWSMLAVIVTALGGAGFLVAMLTSIAFWKAFWQRRATSKEEEWQRTSIGLQSQLSEARRAKERAQYIHTDLERRIRSLNVTNAALQADLDQRNRAERALAQRRQELESSKSVLELHVQARQQELELLQKRYEMILNSAGEGICGFDVEGRMTFVNPAVAKLTGWTIEELIGKTEQEVFQRPGPKGSPSRGGQNPDEQVFYRKDGSCFPVEFIKTPINENGRALGAVLVFKDITERKRVEETLAQRASELARSNAELEQFAFVASHDLQEPLRKIQAFGDRLKAKCEAVQAPETHDYLERMQSAAARMRTLINDLLTFSRVIKKSEPFVPVDLAVVAKEVLGDLEVRIEKSGAVVKVGELPTVDGDAMQMRQLLLNLLSNALKFQPPGNVPVVRLSSRRAATVSGEPLCELSIQDNGIGFDEKYSDRIFAVFQRLHGRNEYEGTGVGLAVCRRIVDRHHGSITARSKPGQGATFIVTLPLRQPKPEAQP